MTQLLIRMEFLGGPLDGAIRPVPAGVETMPLADGMVIHLYTLDEVYSGYGVRQVMRHTKILNVGSERRKS